MQVHVTRALAYFVCLVLSFCAISAQESVQTAATVATGETCAVPEFRFEWEGSSELNLVVSSPVDADYDIWIRPHRSANPLSLFQSDDVRISGGVLSVPRKLAARLQIGSQYHFDGFANSRNNGVKTVRAKLKSLVFVEERVVDETPDGRVVSIRAVGYGDGIEPAPNWGNKYQVSARAGEDAKEDLDSTRFPLLASDGLLVIRWEATSKSGAKLCDPLARGETNPIVALKRHVLSVDAGSTFTFDRDDEVSNHLEFAVLGTSRWTRKVTTFGGMRFSSIGKVAESMDEMASSPAEQAAEDPFREGGSTVEANGWLAFHPWYKKTRVAYPMSAILGAGFTTVPGEVDQLEAKPRLFAGFRMQVARYNVQDAAEEFGNASGYVQFGVAHDELWSYEQALDLDGDPSTPAEITLFEEERRYFVDTEFTVPGIGGDRARLKFRLFADIPTSGDGPSNVRASVLLAVNAQKFFKSVGP